MKAQWQDATTVFIVGPHCPHCRVGKASLVHVRSIQNGDDSVTRRYVCKRCTRRINVVVEPLPEFGNAEVHDG